MFVEPGSTTAMRNGTAASISARCAFFRSQPAPDVSVGYHNIAGRSARIGAQASR